MRPGTCILHAFLFVYGSKIALVFNKCSNSSTFVHQNGYCDIRNPPRARATVSGCQTKGPNTGT